MTPEQEPDQCLDRSLLRRDVLPLLLLFVVLIASAVLLDALLHALGMRWLGRWLGIPGVLMIAASMLYSLRKRNKIGFSTPAKLLAFHKIVAWSGSVLVLVHGGVHFNAILPWLAVAAMLTNVLSGLTGTLLLSRARAHFDAHRLHLLDEGLSADAVDLALHRDSATLSFLRGWRVVHIPIALAFATLALIHIGSILYFWGWQ